MLYLSGCNGIPAWEMQGEDRPPSCFEREPDGDPGYELHTPPILDPAGEHPTAPDHPANFEIIEDPNEMIGKGRVPPEQVIAKLYGDKPKSSQSHR